jgi:hypothetical protein
MPRNLPPLGPYFKLTEEQRHWRKVHQAAGFLPQLPLDVNDRKRLQRNLEAMGFGSHFMYFPWSITSTMLVDE